MSLIDRLEHASEGPVVVVGGTGVLGRRVAALVGERWPQRPVVVVGRSRARFDAIAPALPGARFVAWDLAGAAPLELSAAAVLTTVNDGADRVLVAAMRGGVPLVDVTRWTSRVASAVARASLARPSAPVLLASAWMGGVVPRIAALLAQRAGGAERVETTIAYALGDVAGEDAIDYLDRLWIPYEVTEHGERRVVLPMHDGRTVAVGDRTVRAYLLDTPEQLTLPLSLGARSVRTRLGFDSRWVTRALSWLARLGLFRALRSDALRPVRHALLRSRGKGDETRFRVDVSHGSRTLSAVVRDAHGQAHLTAVGAWLGLRWVLGEGVAAAPPGVLFPEFDPSVGTDLGTLADLGVEVGT